MMDLFIIIFIGVAMVLAVLYLFFGRSKAGNHWQIEGAPDEETVNVQEAAFIAGERRTGHERGGKIVCYWSYHIPDQWRNDWNYLLQHGPANGVYPTVRPEDQKAYSRWC